MNSIELRQSFINFFESKNHKIVESAPLVIKNDPTLMFTNAGMNQFKDVFLGNIDKPFNRVADTQKCLRVSGKHNDLEEVGHDTYHHTMFEMLGNWSFGDYYKKEAIEWAWEYLHETLKIEKDRLYATIFEGDKTDNTEKDAEAYALWTKFLPENQILNGNKKDNFWEMGAQGPCGPCSEIHVDIRPNSEREKISGASLVNKDHPQVIEIWNLVFIQYNRKADGILENLPAKHVDTGMGFERLAMVTQGVLSNYDTDIFQGIIQQLAKIAKVTYGKEQKTDVALRVVADHLRAVSFSIADGQLPSNTGAGYVIRRILRRAIRYGYTFLNMKEPFIYKLLPELQKNMGKAFPEIIKQSTLIEKVIKEEEASFFRTLETGIKLIDNIIAKSENKEISGTNAFELYDTYGFPYDLTELIAKENGFTVNETDFKIALSEQKNRSKKDAVKTTDDWTELLPMQNTQFVGYDQFETNIKITKYRKISEKGNIFYQLIFNTTPFYAESGGQVGDKGYIEDSLGNKTQIINTVKELNLSIHITKSLPQNIESEFKAVIDKHLRTNIANNHSATHLLHYALRQVLGTHVEQKGSLVNSDYLRFDFSHFQKLTADEIEKIEKIANSMIRSNFQIEENRNSTIEQANKMGAMALFGEKYGDKVRVIKFGNSIELCGGTHVSATGNIGIIKITSESAIAAGIRRIEAITGEIAENYFRKEITTINNISDIFKGSKNIIGSIEKLISDNVELSKKIELFNKENAKQIKNFLKTKIQTINGANLIAENIKIDSAESVKDISYQLKSEIENLILIIGAEINEKPLLSIMISDNLVASKNINASKIVRDAAVEINGGGGGQAFYATAGGKNINGLLKSINKAKELVLL